MIVPKWLRNYTIDKRIIDKRIIDKRIRRNKITTVEPDNNSKFIVYLVTSSHPHLCERITTGNKIVGVAGEHSQERRRR